MARKIPDPGEWNIQPARGQLDVSLGCTRKAPARPRDALSPQVSLGSVFCIAPQFAFLTQIFRATIQPLEINGRITAVLHATSFPKI